MRATSERRRARNRGARYAGPVGVAVERRTHDYQGDGPSFICDRCGARVTASHPRHRPGGGQAKPWSVCGPLEVASDRVALPIFTREQADRLYLVTVSQIANRFRVSPSTIRTLRRLPSPVGCLEDITAHPYLYYAPAVETAVSLERPDGFRAYSRVTGGAA